MGTVNSVPVVAQVKSLVQVAGGDAVGAKQTQEDFSKRCVVVAQVRSLVEAVAGDAAAARATQREFVRGVGDFVDGLPVVGHVKGAVHYACGDRDRGDASMKGASRSVGIVIGGIAGMPAGPAGMVAGGVAGGLAVDGVTTGVESAIHGEYMPNGVVAGVTHIAAGDADVGEVFDAAIGCIFDGLAGYGAGHTAATLSQRGQLTSAATTGTHVSTSTARPPVRFSISRTALADMAKKMQDAHDDGDLVLTASELDDAQDLVFEAAPSADGAGAVVMRVST